MPGLTESPGIPDVLFVGQKYLAAIILPDANAKWICYNYISERNTAFGIALSD